MILCNCTKIRVLIIIIVPCMKILTNAAWTTNDTTRCYAKTPMHHWHFCKKKYNFSFFDQEERRINQYSTCTLFKVRETTLKTPFDFESSHVVIKSSSYHHHDQTLFLSLFHFILLQIQSGFLISFSYSSPISQDNNRISLSWFFCSSRSNVLSINTAWFMIHDSWLSTSNGCA